MVNGKRFCRGRMYVCGANDWRTVEVIPGHCCVTEGIADRVRLAHISYCQLDSSRVK